MAFSFLLLLSHSVEGSYIILEDDFTGTDGSAPDNSKWFTQTWDSDDYVQIESNTVRTHSVNGVYARLWTKDAFSTNHFTLEVDMQPRILSGRALEITIRTKVGDVYDEMLVLSYLQANGWEYLVRVNGDMVRVTTFINTLKANNWYSLNLTVDINHFEAVVTPQGSTSPIWNSGNISMDSLKNSNVIHIGGASWANGDPSANWDNFILWDHNPPPQLPKPPIWEDIPILRAVEDVDLIYDFSLNVSDPDSPLENLLIEGDSTFIIDQDHLTITFLFPNGITETTIPLNLSDGQFTVKADIIIIVQPVNDPPSHIAPSEYIAMEDIPRIIDFTPYVWDIDNSTQELYLVSANQYANTTGLILTVIFPEGILEYELTINLTDGLLMTPIELKFDIIPVNDPPKLFLPEVFNVTEDIVTILDLGPWIEDEDTPLDQIFIFVDDEHITVENLFLSILYSTELSDQTVPVRVTDGYSWDVSNLSIHIIGVNDPPVIRAIEPLLIIEETETIISFAPYISDEDNETSDLTLMMDDPAVINITGQSATFLYQAFEPEHTIRLSVSDKIDVVFSNFSVRIVPVNDAPKILGIGELEPPYEIHLNEGTERWYEVEVYDEDDTLFEYSVDSDWEGIIMFSNGTIMLRAQKGDIDNYLASVTVKDSGGLSDTIEISIVIVNVNDPPGIPVITSPANHSYFEVSSDVYFSIHIEDPDIPLGQVLTVRCVSNLSGQLFDGTSIGDLSFSISNLSVGEHHISVIVSDGEYERQASVEINIIKPHTEPQEEDEPFYSTSSGLILIALVVVLVLLAVVNYMIYSKRRALEPQDDSMDEIIEQ